MSCLQGVGLRALLFIVPGHSPSDRLCNCSILNEYHIVRSTQYNVDYMSNDQQIKYIGSVNLLCEHRALENCLWNNIIVCVIRYLYIYTLMLVGRALVWICYVLNKWMLRFFYVFYAIVRCGNLCAHKKCDCLHTPILNTHTRHERFEFGLTTVQWL